MDQDAFRQTYRSVNERFCAYEKAILTNQCQCSEADKFCIAEREGVHCNSDAGQTQCLMYLELLREKARFVLHDLNTTAKRSLPHGKAIKIQVGGLRGLHQALFPAAAPPAVIPDITALLCQAQQDFGDLTALPYSSIMQQIAAYQVKKRARRTLKEPE
jgi:hypothetical protein